MKFTDKQLADLLVSAFEGGSNYWYMLENDNDPPGPYWERVFTHGLRVTNGKIEEYDTPQFKRVILNRDVMLAALETMHAKHPRHYANLISGNEDAETADVFLQLCVLGEVLYG